MQNLITKGINTMQLRFISSSMLTGEANGNNCIRGQGDCPSIYATAEGLNEIITKGEIIKHYQHFYLVDGNKYWNIFLRVFRVGVILKYAPTKANVIDHKEIQKLRKKDQIHQRKLAQNNLKQPKMEIPPQVPILTEASLLKPRENVNPFNKTISPKKSNTYKFMNSSIQYGERDHTDPEQSKNSDEESISMSTYKPNFLKMDKSDLGDRSCIEEDDDGEGVFGTTQKQKRRKNIFPGKEDSLSPFTQQRDRNMNTSFILPRTETLNFEKRPEHDIVSKFDSEA